MNIRVDTDLCQGHAVCKEEAPAVFDLDPATNKVVLKLDRPDESLAAAVKRAVKYCPTRALRLEMG
ncbi:MAG TPA: ferredoxin [Myxococcota bacterium]|nr:ferredoxin [Myxococcota bacterium]